METDVNAEDVQRVTTLRAKNPNALVDCTDAPEISETAGGTSIWTSIGAGSGVTVSSGDEGITYVGICDAADGAHVAMLTNEHALILGRRLIDIANRWASPGG